MRNVVKSYIVAMLLVLFSCSALPIDEEYRDKIVIEAIMKELENFK